MIDQSYYLGPAVRLDPMVGATDGTNLVPSETSNKETNKNMAKGSGFHCALPSRPFSQWPKGLPIQLGPTSEKFTHHQGIQLLRHGNEGGVHDTWWF